MTDSRKSVEDQLDILIRLTALQVLGERSGAEAIAILGGVGLDAKTIAGLIGTTEATVRSRLSVERRRETNDGTHQKRTRTKSASGGD
jgi:hypothetical protein